MSTVEASPAGSRCKPGRRPGPPAGKCTAAGQNTAREEREGRELVGGDGMAEPHNLMRERFKLQF